jgi:HEAT repeat protein
LYAQRPDELPEPFLAGIATFIDRIFIVFTWLGVMFQIAIFPLALFEMLQLPAYLVMLLGMGHAFSSKRAAAALGSLGRDNEANQIQVTQMLIELLSTGSEAAQQRAAQALWSLVKENPSAHDAIARAGDPAALVELLIKGIPDAQDYALWSLSLSISPACQAVVAQSGGVAKLIDKLADLRVEIQQQAADALSKLALNNEETRAAITKQGGVLPLINLIRPDRRPPSPEVVLENAAKALADLAIDPGARDKIVSAGGIPPLVVLLQERRVPLDGDLSVP